MHFLPFILSSCFVYLGVKRWSEVMGNMRICSVLQCRYVYLLALVIVHSLEIKRCKK